MNLPAPLFYLYRSCCCNGHVVAVSSTSEPELGQPPPPPIVHEGPVLVTVLPIHLVYPGGSGEAANMTVGLRDIEAFRSAYQALGVADQFHWNIRSIPGHVLLASG